MNLIPIATLFASSFVVSAGLYADTTKLVPFKTVALRGNIIEIVLLSPHSWLVSGNSHAVPRKADTEEIFTLKDGEVISLHEKHASYDILAQISRLPVGLRVIYKFDGRSFGNSVKNETYFIPAQ